MLASMIARINRSLTVAAPFRAEALSWRGGGLKRDRSLRSRLGAGGGPDYHHRGWTIFRSCWDPCFVTLRLLLACRVDHSPRRSVRL